MGVSRCEFAGYNSHITPVIKSQVSVWDFTTAIDFCIPVKLSTGVYKIWQITKRHAVFTVLKSSHEEHLSGYPPPDHGEPLLKSYYIP